MVHWKTEVSRVHLQVAGSFYAKHWSAGCKGVDAFDHRWDVDEGTGARHLAFINGPFELMGSILEQVRRQRVDCVVIAPDWPRPWVALWQNIPVRARLRIYRPDMFVPGGLVPVAKREQGPKAPRYAVYAHYVLWG